MVFTTSIKLNTNGNADMIDITSDVNQTVQDSGLNNGIVTVFCPSSTSSLTTIEFESGCVSDFQRLFEQIAPQDQDYKHHLRWHDDNGRSHVRAALLKPSLTIPIVDTRLTLGTWQQIIYVDFDTRPRSRELIVQIMGE